MLTANFGLNGRSVEEEKILILPVSEPRSYGRTDSNSVTTRSLFYFGVQFVWKRLFSFLIHAHANPPALWGGYFDACNRRTTVQGPGPCKSIKFRRLTSLRSLGCKWHVPCSVPRRWRSYCVRLYSVQYKLHLTERLFICINCINWYVIGVASPFGC